MPRRRDIENILIIGSGPIVIGQGCEFDYSGTQACKALREEGYRVVLINSNPATIMTDPEMADRTYIEPITPTFVEQVLIHERRDGHPIHAVLPTLGGQTGLNCAMDAVHQGIFKNHGVEMIGADAEAIHKAENRTAFKETMLSIGMDVPRSGIAHSWEEAQRVIETVKLPCCIRPAYTLGGEGGGFCRNHAVFERIARRGLARSRISEILIEEDLYGWKEFELELMRDRADNVVIICSIENVDPMGVHTGDSITVAPIQTLSDKEYQHMRDSAIRIIRAIGVDTGGCNIQFGVDPATGRQVVIEMNPRVSRSSALASKATGYPIARIAAKLAVGYTLDELPNDITKTTPASFEPTIDYVVVKIPRWNFEKFPDADETLSTQMKSVGEAMAIGATFKEAFQKCVRSMEIKRFGYGLDDNDKWLRWKRREGDRTTENGRGESGETASPTRRVEVARAEDRGSAPMEEGSAATPSARVMGGSTAAEAPPDTLEEHAAAWPIPREVLRDKLGRPCQGRPYYIRYAFKMGWSVEQVHELSKIDPWFLEQMRELSEFEDQLLHRERAGAKDHGHQASDSLLHRSKRLGYSSEQYEHALPPTAAAGDADDGHSTVSPRFRLVDTCAAEFEAATPYYYSSYEREPISVGSQKNGAGQDEVRMTDRPKIVVLGGGPNRIGQGIEFDYCCCHASFAARESGYESVMINSNPETVSTDFDSSDMLFFEPLTLEDVLHVIRRLDGKPTIESDGHGDRAGSVKGVIVQFGGQTPLNMAQKLKDAGVTILGTQPEMVHLAEDREEFQQILRELSLLQPPNGIARGRSEAKAIADRIGFPVLVRPSYVLGGRGMKVCNNFEDLNAFFDEAFGASDKAYGSEDNPVLIDKFLSQAIEVDVDAVADFGRQHEDGPKPMCMVAGIMEHIEEAGIHSGDSTCVLPPFSLGRMAVEELFRSTKRLAKRLRVTGAINIQFAILNRTVYVIEVNPRASRTLPFVAKATGVPWAKIATRAMLGEPLADALASHGVRQTPWPKHTAIKAPVFPFEKFDGVDVILGPEMRSTGEAMSIDSTFGRAFAKAQIATRLPLPTSGNALISVNDEDKARSVSIARELHDLGFAIYSTVGTQKVLADAGIPAILVSKHCGSGDAPFLKNLIDDGTLHLLINTPIRTGNASEEGRWRAAATMKRIPLITTLAGAHAAVAGIKALTDAANGEGAVPLGVKPLQEYGIRED